MFPTPNCFHISFNIIIDEKCIYVGAKCLGKTFIILTCK